MSNELEQLTEPARQLRAHFEQEIEPYRRELWRYCLRLSGSVWDAEDLVQETMQRALAKLAELWQPVNPRAYLFRIATNAWLDRRRHEIRQEARELAAADSAIADTAETSLRVRETFGAAAFAESGTRKAARVALQEAWSAPGFPTHCL